MPNYRKELAGLAGARVVGYVENDDTHGLWLNKLGKDYYLFFYSDDECNGQGSFLIQESVDVQVDDATPLRDTWIEGEEDGSKDVVEGRRADIRDARRFPSLWDRDA